MSNSFYVIQNYAINNEFLHLNVFQWLLKSQFYSIELLKDSDI